MLTRWVILLFAIALLVAEGELRAQKPRHDSENSALARQRDALENFLDETHPAVAEMNYRIRQDAVGFHNPDWSRTRPAAESSRVVLNRILRNLRQRVAIIERQLQNPKSAVQPATHTIDAAQE